MTKRKGKKVALRGMEAVESVYGFPFPPELESFSEFWERHGALCSCVNVCAEGALTVFAGSAEKGFDPCSGWPRFYGDPPELFTVLTGSLDGLHWGYWFDDPDDAASDSVVVSYYHAVSYDLTVHASLFEALRRELEFFHRDAATNVEDDPEHASDYQAKLEELARLREAMAEYDLGDRDEVGEEYLERYATSHTGRVIVADTSSRMGIVVPSSRYRPLAKVDRCHERDFAETGAEVDALVAAACAASADGFPGGALKLGHDLWQHRDHARASYAMLDLAYEKLGRPILRDVLARAIAFRARCDREEAGRKGPVS